MSNERRADKVIITRELQTRMYGNTCISRKQNKTIYNQHVLKFQQWFENKNIELSCEIVKQLTKQNTVQSSFQEWMHLCR